MKPYKEHVDAWMKYLHFNPSCILEAGVGRLESCRTRQYWDTNTKCILFEPNPTFHTQLAKAIQPYPNVFLSREALWDHGKGVTFYQFDQSSYVDGVEARSNISRPNRKKRAIEVPSVRLSRYDDGRIDVALIDVESAEWYVLKHMVSRPILIVIELWKYRSKKWKHPDMHHIKKWLGMNGYLEVGRERRDGFFMRPTDG